MPKLQKGKAKVPSDEEMKRLFKIVASSKNPLRDKLIILFSYCLGLRALELASLKLNQIFTPDGVIKQDISLIKTKGNIPRTVYLPSVEADKRFHDTLKDYYQARKERANFRSEGPLFMTQHGGAFTARSMQKRFEQIYQMAGIEGASSHSGRRAFATKLIEMGADIKAVSTLMGHSNIAMTAEYVQDNPDRLKKMISNLSLYI